jgi:hypothetical protein
MQLSYQQLKALKALVSYKKWMRRKDIAARAFNGNAINFVPILNPMVKAKLIETTEDDVDGKVDTVFRATKAGRTASKQPLPERNGASHEALPKVGKTFTKEYKGKTYTVKVLGDEGFQIGGKKYPSLTAAAQGIRDSQSAVNGWAFFGLVKAKA